MEFGQGVISKDRSVLPGYLGGNFWGDQSMHEPLLFRRPAIPSAVLALTHFVYLLTVREIVENVRLVNLELLSLCRMDATLGQKVSLPTEHRVAHGRDPS